MKVKSWPRWHRFTIAATSLLGCAPVRPVLFLAMLALLAGCRNGVGPERCLSPADCAQDQVCLRLVSGAQTCVDVCDANADLICVDDGRSCVTVPLEDAAVDVCFPPGTLAVGAQCARTGDCVAGAVCVSRVGSTSTRCERLCDTTSPTGCAAGETCTPLDGAPAKRGTCIVP